MFQSPRVMKNPNSPGGPEGGKFLPMSVASTPSTCEAQQVVQLQGTADSVVTSQTISIIPGTWDFTVSIIEANSKKGIPILPCLF